MSGERVLLVGLGNPGAEYAGHRHNVGFMALDAIARRERLAWRRSRFHGETAAGRLGEREALLLKPATYMNESGRSVAAAARFYKIPAEDVFVFHDELDLASGKIRVKQGGGAAGHNGLRSIDALFGNAYWRVRLGIGHPGDKRRVLGHVLRRLRRSRPAMARSAAGGDRRACGAAGDGRPARRSPARWRWRWPRPSRERPAPHPSPLPGEREKESGGVPDRRRTPPSSGERASGSERVRGRPPLAKDEP